MERRSADYDHRIKPLATQNEAARPLMPGEGVGPLTASALVATVGEGHAFQHGRQVAAWLGLVPTHPSTGGKTVLGRITKQGNVYWRTLLSHGARAVLPCSAKRPDRKSRWVEAVRRRRGNHSAAVALAAKPARILWALLAHRQEDQVAA